jgi:predicted metallopeptidase
MTISDTIIKRIDTLEQFIKSKAKLITNKRVTIDIVIDLKDRTGTKKALGQIRVVGDIDKNKYYYKILINDEAFERLPIAELKGIILHEMSHIPNYENAIHNKTQKHASHGKEFKSACSKLKTPSKFACAHPHIKKPKRRIVKME